MKKRKSFLSLIAVIFIVFAILAFYWPNFHLIPFLIHIAISILLIVSHFAGIFNSTHFRAPTKRKRLRYHNAILKLFTYTSSLFFIISCFKTQLIWLPIIAFTIIYYFSNKHDDWEFEWQAKALPWITAAIIITGIVSTIIQFSNVRVLGLRLPVFCISILMLIVAAIIVVFSISAMNSYKERRKIKIAKQVAEEKARQAQKEKEAKKSKIKESILLKALYPSQFITISSIKHQIQWSADMNLLLGIMQEIVKSSYNDEDLESVIYLIEEIKIYIKNSKGDIKQAFIGEGYLLKRLQEIQNLIKDPEITKKEEEEKIKFQCHQILTDCSDFNFRSEITICNVKRAIVWGNWMDTMFQEMFKITKESYDDDVLRNISKTCDRIEKYIEEDKDSRSLASYVNEDGLHKNISSIRENLKPINKQT